ncbi:hypothetical protein SAMN05216219_0679 [Mycetocola miduiensis]|uniref:Uncharacterized protein n=1 Tax=Mycetocola miduiensis TaxID=995034 RepID=A0A1I4Z2P9_9MICO|nr:hypothetical protein SAMN05216219_0679 [Mycetocola miduiensis]
MHQAPIGHERGSGGGATPSTAYQCWTRHLLDRETSTAVLVHMTLPLDSIVIAHNLARDGQTEVGLSQWHELAGGGVSVDRCAWRLTPAFHVKLVSRQAQDDTESR